MKPIQVLLLVVVAVIATVLVFFFLRGEQPAPDVAVAPAPRATAPVAPATTPEVEKPAEQPVQPDRTTAAVASDKDDDVDSDAALPVANTLVGAVLNAEEVGVPGAKVLLSKDPLMGDSIAMAFFANRPTTGVVLETVTDAKGGYKFTGVDPARDYYLMAVHPDYAQTQEEGVNVGRLGEYRAPDLIVRAGSKLRGYVANTEGDALANAQVHLDSAYSMGIELKTPDRLTTTTDANGFFEFRNISAGPRQITAEADGYARESFTTPAFLGDSADIHEQNFRLQIGSPIGGRVYGPQNEGIAGARVIAMNYGATTQSRGEAITDKDGAFLVDGLQEGQYIVMVQAVGYRPQSHTRVQVRDLNVQIPMVKQAELTGRVVEAGTDKPVTKFKARLLLAPVGVPDQGNQTQYEATHIEADAGPEKDGSFSLPGVNPGMYVIKVTAAGYASRTTEPFQVVDANNPPAITIQLTKGGSIKGRLVDAATGSPVVGAQISSHDGNTPAGQFDPFFEHLGASRATERKVRSNDDGAFDMKSLAPGRYRLKIEHPDFTYTWVEDLNVAESNATDAGSISLKVGGALSGKVIEGSGKPAVRGWVRLYNPETNDQYQARTDAEGRYSVLHVRPGTYRISATRAAGAGVDAFDSIAEQQQSEVTLQIADGQTVQRDLQLGN